MQQAPQNMSFRAETVSVLRVTRSYRCPRSANTRNTHESGLPRPICALQQEERKALGLGITVGIHEVEWHMITRSAGEQVRTRENANKV